LIKVDSAFHINDGNFKESSKIDCHGWIIGKVGLGPQALETKLAAKSILTTGATTFGSFFNVSLISIHENHPREA
jgi:hypothetical protein